MALTPYQLLSTARHVASSADDPLPFKRHWQNQPVYMSDPVPQIAFGSRAITVGEFIAAADAVLIALLAILVELPLQRPRDAFTVMEALAYRPGALSARKRRIMARRMTRFVSDTIEGKPFRAMPRGAR